MAKKVKPEAAADAAEEAVPTVKEARAAHQKNSDRYAKAVEVEAKASRAAQSGEQLKRLDAYRALVELDAAEEANAETAADVEVSLKKYGKE